MTTDTEDRIHKLLNTLSIYASHLDLSQIKNFLIDLSTEAESDERKRVTELVAICRRRIQQSKGSNWRSELDELATEVEIGRQKLFRI